MGRGAPDFHFMATGVGSVPSLNIQDTCRDILEHTSGIPFWPQFVRRSHLEDMNIQFSEGLPLLEILEEKRRLVVSSGEVESELVTFYERFLAEDVDYFAISREYAPGLFELVEAIGRDPDKYGPYIKGQTVGPVTFTAGVTDQNGKSVLYNPDLLEAMVKGLSIKAVWQVRELSRSGKKPIIFLDEPYLSGFGSAFSPIQRHDVVNLIKEVIDYVKERSDALIGIHCCGNTDWAMVLEAGPDIVNFDAFDYMDSFLLYPDAITRFLDKGGIVAWGIVPTASFSGQESEEMLFSRLRDGISRMKNWGLEEGMVLRQSIITPACGMGTMDQASAERVLELLSILSKSCGGLS